MLDIYIYICVCVCYICTCICSCLLVSMWFLEWWWDARLQAHNAAKSGASALLVVNSEELWGHLESFLALHVVLVPGLALEGAQFKRCSV